MGGTRERDIKAAFTALMPLAPYADAAPIRAQAARDKLRNLPAETAVWLCAVAHIRHVHTDYDALLDEGYERDAARFYVFDDINAKLTEWRSSRYLSADEDLAALDSNEADDQGSD
jgi:hypothetical protein